MKKGKTYVDVAPAIPLPTGKVQAFTYQLDDAKRADRFSLVTVPVGRRKIPGVILEIHQRSPLYPTKPVARLFAARLTREQVLMARWIARTMQGGLGYTLRLFTPPAGLRLAAAGSGSAEASWSRQDALTSRPDPLERSAEVLKKEKNSRKCALIDMAENRYRYLERAVTQHLQQKHQVCICVPEVWMIERLLRVIPGSVAYHAGMLGSEAGTIWRQIYAGEPLAVIGTQKGLFLPWRNLGLVVLEEEQFSSHKLWDQYPRLHNVYGANLLARIHGADMLFASSFPSLRLWRDVHEKQVTTLAYNPVRRRTAITPLSFEDRRNNYLLPMEFTGKLKKWLAAGEKILMVYNQRGSWRSARCRSCEKTVLCPDCKISLTVHGIGKKKMLICHQCGWQQPVPKKCPLCHKGSLRFTGIGTQIIERLVNELSFFRGALVRIDTDVLAQTSAFALRRNIEQSAILLGTSSVFSLVKDRQFDRVVWLFPERGLQYPDFRSTERSRTLLARLQQLLPPRRVLVIVTRRQDLVENHLTSDLESFYERLLKERRRLYYPPLNDLIRLTITSSTVERALKRAEVLRENLERRNGHSPSVLIRGPYQSFLPFRQGKAEVHVTLLGPAAALTRLYDGLPVDIVDLEPMRVL